MSQMSSKAVSKQTAARLQACLEAVQQGETLEQALRRFPEDADRLRPALEADLRAASWLVEQRPTTEPSTGYVQASRHRLLAKLGPASQPQFGAMLPWLRGSLAGYVAVYTPRQIAVQFVLALLLMLNLWFSLDRSVQASRTSLPGDAVYPAKLAIENLRLAFTPDAAGRARLHTEFADQRLMELQALVFEGRFVQIPATVGRYEDHVAGALCAVEQLSSRDLQQARDLALALQYPLGAQTDLVMLLSGGVPLQSLPQFERVRLVSLDSAAQLDRLFSPESGELETLTQQEPLEALAG
jgi:hypothetical protein